MGDLPSGTGQLNLFGVDKKILEEFRSMSKGTGRRGRNRPYGEVFEEIWNEWKALKEMKTVTQLPLRALDAHTVEVLTEADAIIRGLIQGSGKGEPSSLRKTSR